MDSLRDVRRSEGDDVDDKSERLSEAGLLCSEQDTDTSDT